MTVLWTSSRLLRRVLFDRAESSMSLPKLSHYSDLTPMILVLLCDKV